MPRAQFLGLELSHTGVEIATRRVPAARFLPRDLLARATPDDGVDFRATHALCSDVLEHLDDPALLLRHAAAYMAPGCKLVVTVPGGWYSAFYGHIGHRRHYTPAELSDLLENAGFAVERVCAAGFPFFNIYRMLVTLRGRGTDRRSGPRAFAPDARLRRGLRRAVPSEPDAPVGLADGGRRPLSRRVGEPAADPGRPPPAAILCGSVIVQQLAIGRVPHVARPHDR